MQTTLGDALAARGRDSANNFTLIRILAALLVIYGHGAALAAPCADCSDFVTSTLRYYYSGEVAVQVFFVISGFLIAASFASRGDILQFVIARALRIYPALIVFTLTLALVVGPLVTRLPIEQYFGSGAILHFVTMNSSLREVVFTLPGVFEGNRFLEAVNGTLWSLWVEVRLYLLLAAFGALGGITNRLVGNLMLLGLVAWFLLSPATFPLIGGLEQHMRVAAFFGLGMALYINRDQVPLDCRLAALLCVVTYLASGRTEYVILFGGLLAYLTLFVGFLPKLPLPRFVQDYSYGIYLYGWPIQQLIAQMFPDWGPLKMTVVAVPLSVLAGSASWFLVEKPALRLKKTFAPMSGRRGGILLGKRI